jgi:hypothetical protein
MNAIKKRLREILLLLAVSALSAAAVEKIHGELQNELTDKPIADYQIELIQTAFETASMIPAYPHIKDRARAQQDVVNLCLQLDQPARALTYIQSIDNWRKGVCLGDLAIWCGLNGFDELVEPLLQMADKVRSQSEDWRKDRIRVKIEQANTIIGTAKKDGLDEALLAESERGKVAITQASLCDADAFEKQTAELDRMISTGIYDVVNNCLSAYSVLFERFYNDKTKREMIAEKIEKSWNALPIFTRVELLLKLSDICVKNDDSQNGASFVAQAQNIIDSYQLRPEHKIEMQSQISSMNFKAGNEDAAKSEMTQTLELFRNERGKIVDIYRSAALQKLAEAYKAAGMEHRSLDVYKLALTEGLQNPNSRPRALDIVSLCCSMAKNELKPDSKLLEDINAAKGRLSDPW